MGNLHTRTADPNRIPDEKFMAAALDVARAIGERPWPNPPVGAVVVKDGQVVGSGAHQGAGRPHAEQVALAQAGARAVGATMYVTLEPCNHEGRTPPCAPAVVQSGIRRVVAAIRDPNPRVAGGGCRFLSERGVSVQLGVMAREALDLVWPFVVTGGFGRPYLELKLAQSLDGLFAPDPRRRDAHAPVYLTGTLSRVEVHRRRCWMDAVIVGEGTVLADRPRLDARLAGKPGDGPRVRPRPVCLDSDLSLDPSLVGDPWLVLTGSTGLSGRRARDLARSGAEVVAVPTRNGRLDPEGVLAALNEAGLRTALLEGGPRLAASFLQAGVVDRWTLFTAPVVLGAGVGWPAERGAKDSFSLTRVARCGQDTMAVYDRLSFLDQLLKVMA